MQPALSEDTSEDVSIPGSVSQELLEAKIQEVESATDMGEQAKTKLLELYREALKNLQEEDANIKQADVFQHTAMTAPSEIQALREASDKQSAAPIDDALDVDVNSSLDKIEQLLQKEKANRAIEDARRADFEKYIAEEEARPEMIRLRLTEAREDQKEIAAQLKIPPPTDEDPALSKAKRWALEAKYDALSAEIKMLNQELLSQPLRLDLLRAKQDRAAANVDWLGKRVEILGDLDAHKRQEEAQQARASAEETRRDVEGKHWLVVRVARQNAALTGEILNMTSQLERLREQAEESDKLARQIEDDFKIATETMAIGGLGQELGQMLLQQRQSLPDLRVFRHKAEELEEQAAEIGIRRLRHRQEQKHLRHVQDFVAGIMTEAQTEETPELLKELSDLAIERKALLAKSIESDDLYLRSLGELEAAQQQLLGAIADYDGFLDEHLLWVRSASHAELRGLGALPEQIWRIISPTGWLEVTQSLTYQARHSPTFVLLALTLGVLLWSRKHLIAAIRNISEHLGKPMTDKFAYSIQVLVLTLIVAATWPLVMLVTGWQLKVSLEATNFSNVVGGSLIVVAKHVFFLRVFYLICMPGGLAAAHFRWPESSLRMLRTELNRLTWIFLPVGTVLIIVFYLDPLNLGWAIGRTSFTILVLTLAFTFYRLLNPKQGILAGYLRRSDKQTFRQLHRFWYPLSVAIPLALVVLTLLGYSYTAGTLLTLLLETCWMIVSLLILNALAERWLLVTRRRLVYEAAMERQLAIAEENQEQEKLHTGEEGMAVEVEEPVVDLVALSDTSRDLLNTAVLVTGLIGLWLIWSELFPALRILDDVTLWHQTVTEGGEDKRLPITLADIGLALIFAATTFILAKKLPAVLEMILLLRFDMSSGSRYTITTLTTYSIVSIGILLVFDTIGAQWSQLQWLVAALGVGIGFGLQEIVANFISGLIILFERPIRVGDVVSVGETDGVVTRIRIRATTIRNWDNKELLVPNKEFITGHLLNWSLSDQTTRLLISVGIAYGANVRQAMELLKEAAREHKDVLDDPEPSVIFEVFGDNALTLVLRCFVESVDLRLLTISALNQVINDKFNEAGIVIAFPQRDLHLDTLTPLRVSIEDKRNEKSAGNNTKIDSE